ncbi:MAG TPA: single-stranded DNA-binding protein [Baekduia sp.]|nr:single-stranded DNA-binding protein [Baekduia sp.]
MNINHLTITGNLTADPELRSLPSGASVCKLRLASSTRQKNAEGEYEDRPNYFDVIVWGSQGENVARYLERGRKIGVVGQLRWREWDEKDSDGQPTGRKRQTIEIVADQVEFLDGKRPQDDGAGEIDPEADREMAGVGASDDGDIPF